MYGLVGFSRSQSNGFLIFLPLVMVALFSGPAYRTWKLSRGSAYSEDAHRLDSLVLLLDSAPQAKTSSSNASTPSTARHIIAFDPNIAEAKTLLRAGLNEKLANRIINYRNKGGKFRIKKDLLKIYGFDSVQFIAIRPYLRLPDKIVQPERRSQTTGDFGKPLPREKVDLNLADTAALKKIYGVGEKLSLRILKYREALGGFVSWKQLGEVYKLDTGLIQLFQRDFYIREAFTPQRINLNTAGRQALATHPYLSQKAADAIVAYRFQHGEFTSIEDLRKIPMIDSVTLRNVSPYLKVDKP
jgi:competence protein ComEA